MTKREKIFYAPSRFQSYQDAEINAVEEWLKNNTLDDTKIIEQFEARMCELFKTKYGIMVNSGSSANLLACLAVGVGPGQEVITPTCTFPTTLSPIIFLGATPVFCDIYANHYVPSVEQVLACVTPKTTTVLIPDLVGDKFDFITLRKELEKIGRTDIKLIEDACDTVTECDGDIATISFYASHVISAGGLGGMVLCSDPELAEKCKLYRNHGAWDLRAPGFCAAFGIINASKFDAMKAARSRNLKHYIDRLKNNNFFELPANTDALWLSMPLVVKSHRFEIVEELEARGIQTRLCMAGNILRQPFYSTLFPNVDPNGFPETDKVFERGMLIGLHNGISDEDVDWVCDQLEELAAKYTE